MFHLKYNSCLCLVSLQNFASNNSSRSQLLYVKVQYELFYSRTNCKFVKFTDSVGSDYGSWKRFVAGVWSVLLLMTVFCLCFTFPGTGMLFTLAALLVPYVCGWALICSGIASASLPPDPLPLSQCLVLSTKRPLRNTPPGLRLSTPDGEITVCPLYAEGIRSEITCWWMWHEDYSYLLGQS